MAKVSFGKSRAIPGENRPAPKAVIQTDPRKTKRTRTFLSGRLAYGNGAFTVDCTVCDISPAGARVRVQDGAIVPGSVYLVLLRARTAFQATVKWRRRDGNIGLKFNSRHSLEQADTAELRTLRRYCLDAFAGGMASAPRAKTRR